MKGATKMQKIDFQTIAHAKWILAGEHAVLRGSPALVFPIPSKSVKLSYVEKSDTLTADFDAPYGETLLMFFWGVLETGLKVVEKNRSDIQGHFFLENNIPMGAGLGFSAALCVVVARWFLWRNWIAEADLFEFARRLEDNFHGKSSGVDIAGVITKHGMHYKIGEGMSPVHYQWQPHIYLSYSDQLGVTATCIKKVKELWEKDEALGKAIDQQMIDSVLLAEQALQMNEQDGMLALTTALRQAHHCFVQWGLVQGELQNHCEQLLNAGALAVKPTGAGGGGYVLSLWPHPPINKLSFELIPAFEGHKV